MEKPKEQIKIIIIDDKSTSREAIARKLNGLTCNINQTGQNGFALLKIIFALVLLFIFTFLIIATIKNRKISNRYAEVKSYEALHFMEKAIRQYRYYNKKYPLTLHEIVPVYIKQLPEIPMCKNLKKGYRNTWKMDPTPETPITGSDIDNTTAYIYNSKTGEIEINKN